MFGFQARSNYFAWKSFIQLAIQQNPTHKKKNWVHTILEVKQTLSFVIKQSGTHIRKTQMEQQ